MRRLSIPWFSMVTKPYSAYAAAMSCANFGLRAVRASSVGTWSDMRRLLCLPILRCRSRHMPAASSQVCSAVLMVRPRCFGFNAQTANSNRFQQPGATADVAAQALAEFDAFAAALSGEGVSVCVAADSREQDLPDALFPNNWVSFHADGTVVLYPMHAENRRAERRPEIIEAVVRETGFQVRRTLDLTRHENEGRFLEGTGSLVLDHRARIAYACRSPRTDETVAYEWAREMGFELEMFTATDETGTPIYHTNVLMYVGTRLAVVAVDAIAPADRARVSGRLV